MNDRSSSNAACLLPSRGSAARQAAWRPAVGTARDESAGWPRAATVDRFPILIAHASPLIVAGLVTTLQRDPRCDITVLDRDRIGGDGVPHLPGRHVVIGDEYLGSSATRLGHGRPARGCASWAFFVVVTSTGTDSRARPVDGLVDAWLSTDCDAMELLATVFSPLETADDASPAPRQKERVAVRPIVRGGIAPRTLRGVCDYIESRLSERIGLDDLSRLAGLSSCHFSRAFKQSTGLPPHRYLTLRRIEAAARLVKETERSFAEISFDVGFSDQSHFTKTFSQVTGDTPRVFRRRYR